MTNSIFDEASNTDLIGALKLDNIEDSNSQLAIFHASVLRPMETQKSNIISRILDEIDDFANYGNHVKGHANGCFSKGGPSHTKACFSKSNM